MEEEETEMEGAEGGQDGGGTYGDGGKFGGGLGGVIVRLLISKSLDEMFTPNTVVKLAAILSSNASYTSDDVFVLNKRTFIVKASTVGDCINFRILSSCRLKAIAISV